MAPVCEVAKTVTAFLSIVAERTLVAVVADEGGPAEVVQDAFESIRLETVGLGLGSSPSKWWLVRLAELAASSLDDGPTSSRHRVYRLPNRHSPSEFTFSR